MNNEARPLALVTGASSGIGADLARELARDGHDLVLVARGVEAMETLTRELESIGARSVIIVADLSVQGSAAKLVQEIDERKLSVDVLINNAGFGDRARFQNADADKLSRMLQLNIVSLTELTRLLVPKMMERGRGKILLVSSTAAFQPVPNMAVYAATKAYVLSLGEALAHEFQGTGVTVTTLCPGPTKTRFAAVAHANDSVAFQRQGGLMESSIVAAQGYRALKRGRRTIVSGLANTIGAIGARIIPRSIAATIAGSLMAEPTPSSTKS